MKTYFLVTASIVALAAANGCSSDVQLQGAGGTTGVSSSDGAPGPVGSEDAIAVSATSSGSISGGTGGGSSIGGDCATDADCPMGGVCVQMSPGGWRACAYPPTLSMGCDPNSGDMCCLKTDCPPDEQCFAGPVLPSCGGVEFGGNSCSEDQCKSDGDCETDGAAAFCAPAGVYGRQVRSCFFASCSTDGDCAPGSRCAPVVDACCSQPDSFLCVPPDGCRSNADCGNEVCVVDPSGAPHCTNNPPPCPG